MAIALAGFLALAINASDGHAQDNYTDEYNGITVFSGLGTVQQTRGKACGAYAEWDSSELLVPQLGPVLGIRVECLAEGYSATSTGPETLVSIEFGNSDAIDVLLPGISYDEINLNQEDIGAPLSIRVFVASEASVHGFSVPSISINAKSPNDTVDATVASNLAWWNEGQCIFDGGDRPWVQALFEVQDQYLVTRQVINAYTTGIVRGAKYEPYIKCGITHCVAEMDNRGTDTSIFELAAEAMSWEGVQCVASRYNEEDQPPLMITHVRHGTFGMNTLNFRSVASDRLVEIVSEIFTNSQTQLSAFFPMPNRGYRFSVIGPGSALPGMRSNRHWFLLAIEVELDARPIGEEIEIRVSEIRQVRYPNDAPTIDLEFFSKAQPMATEDPITWVPTEIGAQGRDFLAYFVGELNRRIDGRIIGLFQ